MSRRSASPRTGRCAARASPPASVRRTPGDLKESLDWGPAGPGVRLARAASGLREAFEAYYATVSGLGERLRRLFALALGLPEDWFDDAFRGHSSSMRVINYPPPEAEAEPGQLRAGAHTDYGCMTILRTENAPGGLQVQTRAGSGSTSRPFPDRS